MRSTISRIFLPVAGFALFALSAGATTVTVLGASSQYPGYAATNAADGDLSTDWASFSQGNGSYINLMLSAGTVNHVDLTDRTSSGGGNGCQCYGTTDFTTTFTLDFYSDATFMNLVGSKTFTKSTPTNIAGFSFSGGFTPETAQYVRYTVNAQNGGGNPGLAEISFSNVPATTPEPGSLALLGTGVLGIAGMARRRFLK